MIDRLGDVAAVLGAADTPMKARFYGSLGVELTYQPTRQRVLVEASPWALERVRGGSSTIRTWPEIRGELDLAAT